MLTINCSKKEVCPIFIQYFNLILINRVFGNYNHEYTSYLRRQKSGRLFLDEFPISCITNLCRLHLLYQVPGAKTYAWSSSLWTQRSHHLLQHNSTRIEYLFGLQGIKIFTNKNQSLHIVWIFLFYLCSRWHTLGFGATVSAARFTKPFFILF